MAKNGDTIRFDGEIVDVMPSATFKVRLPNGHEVLSYVSGKMRKNHIRILLGDIVEVELSPYDLSRGRIVRRK